jgi:hypothetical protein
MLEKPNYAPGCFGKVYTFAADPVCGACVFAGQCEPASKRAMEQLREMFGVKTPTRTRSGLPVKVKQVFDALGKTEEEVRDAMLSGQNPYRVSDGPVGIVAHLLLQFGKVERSHLVQAVGKHRDLGAETSSVYTRYAIQILTHCGAAEVDGSAIQIIRG